MKKFVFAAAMLVFLGLNSQVFAEPWAGQNWDLTTDGVNGSFGLDENNVVNFLNTADGEGWAFAVNSNALDFTQDFTYGLRYHLDAGQQGIVSMEVGVRDDNGDALGPVLSSYYGERDMYFMDNYWGASMDEVDNTVDGIPPTDGWLGVKYTRDTDTIGFGLSDESGLLRGGEISGFAQDYIDPEYNPEGFKFFLAGWSGGDEVLPGMVTFSDLSVNGNTPVTPEPVSSMLFLLGGGTLALRRFKRKK